MASIERDWEIRAKKQNWEIRAKKQNWEIRAKKQKRIIAFIFAVLIVLTGLAVAFTPNLHAAHSVTIHERVSLSRTCPNGGRWYLDESDSDTAMLICTYSADDESGDGPASQ